MLVEIWWLLISEDCVQRRKLRMLKCFKSLIDMLVFIE